MACWPSSTNMQKGVEGKYLAHAEDFPKFYLLNVKLLVSSYTRLFSKFWFSFHQEPEAF